MQRRLSKICSLCHRLGYVHIWRYAGGVAIPLSSADVTIYCVTLRCFSNLPLAKQSSKPSQAGLDHNSATCTNALLKTLTTTLERAVFSFGNDKAKQSFQVFQIVFTSYHWSQCLILDHFTSHGKHKDVTEKYALSKHHPDKRRQKTLCLSNKLKIRMKTHFSERKFTFGKPFHCQQGVQANRLQVSHYEAASEAWRR